MNGGKGQEGMIGKMQKCKLKRYDIPQPSCPHKSNIFYIFNDCYHSQIRQGLLITRLYRQNHRLNTGDKKGNQRGEVNDNTCNIFSGYLPHVADKDNRNMKMHAGGGI